MRGGTAGHFSAGKSHFPEEKCLPYRFSARKSEGFQENLRGGGLGGGACSPVRLLFKPRLHALRERGAEVDVLPALGAHEPMTDAQLDTMFERAVTLAPDDQSLHYAFLLDPDKAAAKEKFMKLYEQRRPLYERFRK